MCPFLRDCSVVCHPMCCCQLSVSATLIRVRSTNHVALHAQIPKHWPEGALEATPLPDLDAMVLDAGVTTDRPFLFIGVLSSKRTFRRRVNVRGTWLRFVTHMPTSSVQVRFVLAADEVRTLLVRMLFNLKGLV